MRKNFKIINFIFRLKNNKMTITENMNCIRNFQELSKLKARSRLPIDIHDLQSQSAINFSSINNPLKEQPQLKEEPLVKYFSFVNKLYDRPKILKRETRSLEPISDLLKSSSSISNAEQYCTSVSSDDSGCFTRSSVLSSYSTSPSSSDETDFNEISFEKLDEQEIMRMKSVCHQLFSKQRSLDWAMQNQQQVKPKKRTKILTILFDFEDNNNLNSKKFSVSRGETVFLIREFNEKYYLVLKVNNGTLGYIPKDYTIDLKEIKRKLKKQSLQNFNTKLTQL